MQGDVDHGVAVVGIGLLEELDEPDEVALELDHHPDTLVLVVQTGLQPLGVLARPPLGHLGNGEELGQRRHVVGRHGTQAHLSALEHRASFDRMNGPLALVGGGEWRDGCTFDRDLLEASGGDEVLVLPTAAAYEHPERAVESAERLVRRPRRQVRGLMVLARPDAENDANVAAVQEARFLYLAGGSPLHLRSVLKDSAVWDALVEAWHDGAVLAGSSAGAMALCDPMVDPRGGAFTLGLGLMDQVAVIPHPDTWSPDKAQPHVRAGAQGLPSSASTSRPP